MHAWSETNLSFLIYIEAVNLQECLALSVASVTLCVEHLKGTTANVTAAPNSLFWNMHIPDTLFRFIVPDVKDEQFDLQPIVFSMTL